VQTDLEAAGYEVFPFLLPAAGVDAPHERYRIWFVAYSREIRQRGWSRPISAADRSQSDKHEEIRKDIYKQIEGYSPVGFVTDTDSTGFQASRSEQQATRPKQHRKLGGVNANSNIINDDLSGLQSSSVTQQQKAGVFKDITANAISNRIEKGMVRKQPKQLNPDGKKKRVTTVDEHTNGKRCRKQHDAEVTTEPRLSCERSNEHWDNWPTQPPVCNGDDGFPTDILRQRIRDNSDGYLTEKEINKIISKALTAWRIESIKAGGNAIVHQVVLKIFKAIEAYNNLAA
jgi:DNA (cytosine-5)-methyltransferase 1